MIMGRVGLGLLTALLLTLVAVPSAFANDGKHTCYYAQYWDSDGDGHAVPWAPRVEFMGLNHLEVMECPDGYVARADDCNDSNANVHPRHSEAAFNGVDDNCDGQIDEPTFVYPWNPSGYVTTDTATVHVTINDWNTWSYRQHLNVYGQVTAIDGSSAPVTFWLPTTWTGGTDFTFNLANLAPAKVYRIDGLQVYANDSYTIRGPHYSAVGPQAGRFYTMTQGTTTAQHHRTAMVLSALRELGENQLGLVGYRGTAARDGTRYGVFFSSDAWCSEFYGWNVLGAGGRVYQNTRTYFATGTVENIEAYFSQNGQLYGNTVWTIPTVAEPGDYLAMDTDADGATNHSGMFLGFNAATMNVISVEGNVDDEVQVVERPLNATLHVALGHLAPIMMW